MEKTTETPYLGEFYRNCISWGNSRENTRRIHSFIRLREGRGPGWLTEYHIRHDRLSA